METKDYYRKVQEDGTQITLIRSSIKPEMWHVILEFLELSDYDNNYLDTAAVSEIYGEEIWNV